MGRQYMQLQRWAIIVVLLAPIIGIASGCGSPPPQVEIVVSPSISILEFGKKLTLSANATGRELTYQWTITGPGRLLEPTTDPAVIYQATELGDVVVTVAVRDKDGQVTTKSYRFTVGPPQVTPTATATSTPTTAPVRPPDTLTPTTTPTVTGAVVRPTDTPTPSPTKPPSLSVAITNPTKVIDCPNIPACNFTVEGTSSGVTTNPDLRIFILVFPLNPPGAGWYPQAYPATVEADGTWLQTPSWIGNVSAPVKTGHTLQVVAIIAHKDAAGKGIKLTQWPGDQTIASYLDVLPAPLAVSGIVRLEVQVK